MTDPILIGGGGIGGLCAGLALARAGFPVRILEQMNAFSEAGAGIQVGANAMRLLEKLYRLGLHLCPRSFREDYGDEVAKDFARLAREILMPTG